MKHQVLHGVRILDFTTNLPGPFGTQVLADFGADVIMVEGPAGDPARKSPPMYSAGHRNKRSITIDLKDPSGVQTALRLAATCDVITESFRPGVLERLGLGYEAVRAVRPDVIYCSVSGYGQSGPQRLEPGHDINYLAASGALSFSGHWGQPPARPGIPFVDLASSLYLAIAVLLALRETERSGKGALIDLSMTDVAMSLASPRGGPRMDLGGERQPHLRPTNDLFETADGVRLAVGAIEEHFWEGLRAVLSEIEPLLADSRFDTPTSRRLHGDELVALLRKTFARRTLADWLQLLEHVDVPVTPVITMGEASDSERVRQRGLVQEMAGVRHVMVPFLWDTEQPGRLQNAAPEFGQHTAEILAELAAIESARNPSPPGG
jgi:crotonobetainyl-CoA:carnitine CoA-transferase CaiB-like acyl-CoA transferase